MAGEGSPGRRILVIDDEDAVRSMLMRALALWGYAPVPAASGEEALEALRTEGPFACALLDLTMPGMGGEAVLDEIERLAPGLPVALMSGYPRDDLARGNRRFLAKPFDLQSLRAVVDELAGA